MNVQPFIVSYKPAGAIRQFTTGGAFRNLDYVQVRASEANK